MLGGRRRLLEVSQMARLRTRAAGLYAAVLGTKAVIVGRRRV